MKTEVGGGRGRRLLAGARTFVGRHELLVGVAVVGLVAVVSVLFTMQGWRAKVPAFDLLTYIYSADDLLTQGSLPQHGDTGSYGSLKPPGTAWLMLPSRILTNDPRLVEYAGTALLHVAALLGIFLVARRYFGFLAAVAAVVLYGVSAHGLFLAGSLWPNGRPDFFILTVLLASQWVVRSDARFLAGGLALWAIAMYVDMAHAPALLIFPALWLYYRPPVRSVPLAAAAILVLLAWSPYLHFEAGRGFADIRSQLLLQDIFPADYSTAWCDPSREFVSLPNVSESDGDAIHGAQADGPPGGGPAALAVSLVDKSMSNFSQGTVIPLGDVALGLLVGASVLLASLPARQSGTGGTTGLRFSRRRLSAAAAALIAAGAVLHLPLEGLFGMPLEAAGTARRVGLLLAVCGMALLVVPWSAAVLGGFLERRGVSVQTVQQAEARRLLVFSLLIPWVVLIAVAEPGKPERFWWLWPLQVIFLAGLVFEFLPRMLSRRAAWLVFAGVLVIVVANASLFSRLESWRLDGWAGADAEEVRVVDYVAGLVQADGGEHASIGYQTYVYPFMAAYHITNPVYKVGAEMDLFLRDRHGITNTNRCAEGIGLADQYRIVQTRTKATPFAPRHYFAEPLEPDFELLREFDLYQVWVRQAPGTSNGGS